MSRTAEIKRRLEKAFAPEVLEVIDDSLRHAGHAAAGDETHYTVRIVSAAFAGKSRVERHRMVNDALKDLFDVGLHALAVKAEAPAA